MMRIADLFRSVFVSGDCSSSGMGGEEGFSLVELAVAMAMLGIIGLGATNTLTSWDSTAAQTSSASQTSDQVHIAVQTVNRQVSSALTIYDPSTEGTNPGTSPDGQAIPAGFSLRVFTESNGTYQCDQWRILDTGDLQQRSWSPGWVQGQPVTAWGTVATGISNTSNQTPFILDTNSGFGGNGGVGTNYSRLLDVNLYDNQSGTSISPVQYTTSVAGRDVEYVPTGTSDCSSVPPA